MPVQNPLGELRQRLHTLPRWSPGSVVAVAGTGVSIQATKGLPEEGGRAASWRGLLDLAIAYTDGLKKKPRGWNAIPLRQALANRPLVADLLTVASAVESALRKAGALQAFLSETIGTLRPTDTEVLRALGLLGVPMATTNYDGLIEWAHEPLQAVTWRHAAAVDEWMTGKQPGVLHLHGHFRVLDSVVLGRTCRSRPCPGSTPSSIATSCLRWRAWSPATR